MKQKYHINKQYREDPARDYELELHNKRIDLVVQRNRQDLKLKRDFMESRNLMQIDQSNVRQEIVQEKQFKRE